MLTNQTNAINPVLPFEASDSFSYEETYECFFRQPEIIKTISEISEEKNQNLLLIDKWWSS